MNIRTQLEKHISQALVEAGAPEGSPAMVAPAAKPEFGDYQANGVMAAAKRTKTNPRQLAGKVLEVMGDRLAGITSKLEIAGPGFINITLDKQWLAAQLLAMQTDDRLGVERAAQPQTVVVDYSAPNLAKEMHVGHLRSTIIGDSLARVLDFVGNKVVRQNHVGDWGTQFGMLVAYEQEYTQNLTREHPGQGVVWNIPDMENFYREAKLRFDENPDFAQRAHECVVLLQRGDPNILRRWERVVTASLEHCFSVYARLGVQLRPEDTCGESFYGGVDVQSQTYDPRNNLLPNVIERLEKELGPKGMFKESQGAQCVFLPEFVGKDGAPLPLIVQKSDEGYLYATTDLAAIRYRVHELHADRVLYVVDARQSLHFRMVFATARTAKFVGENVSLEHVGFGTMMGPDGKPFKTRTGGTVKLMDLLSEGVDKALALVNQKNQDDVEKGRAAALSDEDKQQIAQTVGIGAVKYADLSQNRNSDYVFSWDKMLSLEGNTAPYMQYAYARVRSIYRKGGLDASHATGRIEANEPAERALAVKLLQFPEAISTVAAECLPNVLCAYLYDLAGAFTGFYENCPVLKSDEPTRTSRLALCDLTARTIRTGLDLLGIGTIEQM